MTLALLGIDFTSAPTRRKPITAARGTLTGARLALQRVETLADFGAFEALLAEPGPWLGGFDFPFGLPREFAESLELGDSADSMMSAIMSRCPDRMAFRALIDTWGNGRPSGQRLTHRRTDTVGAARSTSPLQTRYVPVGFMYFEGMSRLLRAGVHIPGLREGDRSRCAVEAYPGRLVHELIGRRSYKNGKDSARWVARKDLLSALELGHGLHGIRVALSAGQHDQIVADSQGDLLDAVLCLVQAAWASRPEGYGLPSGVDPLEGWIVGASPAFDPAGAAGALKTKASKT